MEKLKKRVYEIIEIASPDDVPSKIFDIFILTLILLNVLAVIAGTVESLYSKYSVYFNAFEAFSVIIFTVEYFLRLWTCTVKDKYKNSISGRLRFALTPLLIIDLLAILPFYLPMFFVFDSRFLRALRLFRLLRILKVIRYSDSLSLFSRVFHNKKEDLFMSLSFIVILLILVSSVMYYIENTEQPESFSSIPATMWWGIATLTTVGYGDMYPVTPLGKFLGGLIAILGLALFALPTGIIASGFSEELERKNADRKKETCPHCGRELNG